MRYLIEILPQEELRSCVISYCRHRDRRLPIDKSNHRRSMISDSTLKWLLKELENIHESKYHKAKKVCQEAKQEQKRLFDPRAY